MRIQKDDLTHIATGAAFLGTGGGGDPYIGRLLAMNAVEQFGMPSVIDADALPDDAQVFTIAMLGVPTLLWRDCSERPDGLGDNIVLSRYDRDIVDDFLRDPQQYRRPRQLPEVSPTAQILTELAEWR